MNRAWTDNSALENRVSNEKLGLPPEWQVLHERVATLPVSMRRELEPFVTEALEQARFREKVVMLAREALERMSLEFKAMQFDLEATRREREQMRHALESKRSED